MNEKLDSNDPFDLNHFVLAQESKYQNALAEIRNGHKWGHWMWYIFPQLDGLGKTAKSQIYAIKSLEEAEHYLRHPILGSRLRECTEAVLAVEGRLISEVFPDPDDLKLRSCMTLFSCVPGSSLLFTRLLDKYFKGQKDPRTLRLLEGLSKRAKEAPLG